MQEIHLVDLDSELTKSIKNRNLERTEFMLIRHDLDMRIQEANLSKYHSYVEGSILIGNDPKTYEEFIK